MCMKESTNHREGSACDHCNVYWIVALAWELVCVSALAHTSIFVCCVVEITLLLNFDVGQRGWDYVNRRKAR